VPASRCKQAPKPALRWVAVFCALTVWLLGLLATSPQLHAALHADADHTDHECAITLFSHGIEDGTACALLASVPLLQVENKSAIQPISSVADALHRLPPGRGPPVC